MNISDLIQSHHLTRRAVIYVRQSSPHQVLNNQESQRQITVGIERADFRIGVAHTARPTDGGNSEQSPAW